MFNYRGSTIPQGHFFLKEACHSVHENTKLPVISCSCIKISKKRNRRIFLFSKTTLLLQNEMETTNSSRFGIVGRSGQLRGVSKIVRSPAVRLLVSPAIRPECGTERGRYLLQTSRSGGGCHSPKASTVPSLPARNESRYTRTERPLRLPGSQQFPQHAVQLLQQPNIGSSTTQIT